MESHVDESVSSARLPEGCIQPLSASDDDAELFPMSEYIFFPHFLAIVNFFAECSPLFCIAQQPVLDSLSANHLGIINVLCLFCHAFCWFDECVSSLRAHNPEFVSCCAHGKVWLTPLCVPPADLNNLFTANTLQAKEFRVNIVQYNAAMAFTSLGVKVNESVLLHGPPIFRIHGELHHLSGSLLPKETVAPCYSQLYIYDPHAAYQYCISQNKNLSLNTMQVLQYVMSNYNAYAPIYQHAYEVLQRYDAPDYTVKLCVLPGHDP